MKYTINDTNTKADNEYVVIKKEEQQSSPSLPEEEIELINQRIDTIESKDEEQDEDIEANANSISTLQTSVGTNTDNISTLQINFTELAIKTVADFKTAILDYVYPVGSVAIFYNTVSPSTTLGGTWEKISSGNFLEQSDSDSNLNKYVDQGLPNITGEFSAQADGYGGAVYGNGYRLGAFYGNYHNPSLTTDWATCHVDGDKSNGDYYKNRYGFDASKSNNIYGKSEKVQPNSFKVNIWKRTA